MDRAALLSAIYRRQALRREALLPLLDIKSEYQHEVAVAEWQTIVAGHYDRVRAEVVAERLGRKGPGSCESAGARWVIEAETARRLTNPSYRARS